MRHNVLHKQHGTIFYKTLISVRLPRIARSNRRHEKLVLSLYFVAHLVGPTFNIVYVRAVTLLYVKRVRSDEFCLVSFVSACPLRVVRALLAYT